MFLPGTSTGLNKKFLMEVTLLTQQYHGTNYDRDIN